MKFTFLEEFPTPNNLEKLNLVNFPVNIAIHTPDLNSFWKVEKRIIKLYPQVQKVIYWPLLKESQGYWFSPFVNKEALQKKINEILGAKREKLSLLWDSEIPLIRLPLLENVTKFYICLNLLWGGTFFNGLWLNLSALFHKDFHSNKKRIEDFMKKASEKGLEIITTEHPPILISEQVLEKLGLAFDPDIYKVTKCKMFYSSWKKIVAFSFFHSNLNSSLRRKTNQAIGELTKRYGSRFMISLGCIAEGKYRDGYVLTPGELELDLKLARERKIKGVMIYRLGGLNRDFVSLLMRYTS